MKKVLVIGSEGNIGKELVKYLKTKNYEVYESDQNPGWRSGYFQANINNAIDLVKVFQSVEPSIVYHMAAMVSRVTCEATPGLAVETNLLGLQNVIEVCKMFDSRMVYFSTSEVYGNQEGILYEDKTIPQPNNRYGLTKYLGEALVEHDVKFHGLDAVTVRPFMFYHEDETRGDHRSAMIRFIDGLSKGRKIDIHMNSERAWFHLDDAVRALEKVAITPGYDIYNLGSDEYISTLSLAQIIADELSINLDDYANKVDLPEQMTLIKRPSLEKMRIKLGISPAVKVTEGIKRVIKSMKDKGEL
jgi:nucleoside-diphosphate-sugar epimerase